MDLDTFTKAYVDAMLWSETDNSTESGGEPLDANYSVSDLSPLTLANIWKECRDFQEAFKTMIEGNESQAGHDFWLTRNGHGAGFWDRPELYGETAAEVLTQASKACGARNPTVGDDGKLYIDEYCEAPPSDSPGM